MIRVKNGDLDMLGLLFERYHKMLFTFFYRIHHSSETSEDLVQNVFMRILKYRKGFSGDGSFKVWMFHIARNVSHDHFKKAKRTGHWEDLSNWDDRLSDHKEKKEREEKDFQLVLLNKALQTLEVEKRELITDSGGPGKKKGGLGRRMILRIPDDETAPIPPVNLGIQSGRYRYPPEGLFGGKEGHKAQFLINGEPGNPYG